MIRTQLTRLLALALGTMLLAPAFAFAQSLGATAAVNANASVGATGVSASATTSAKLTAAETKAQQKGDQEIARRITALNNLNTRVAGMQEVTAQFKSGLAAEVQTEISTLTTLQAKVDADTDLATLKTDIQSITASYRVYALILPQGRIAAAADRIVTITSMMNDIGSKLQARIQAAGSAGANVTSLTTTLQDLATNMTNAQTQAQNAVTATASLQPDQGNATVAASNTAALKAGKTDIQTAQQDLVAARKDITTLVNGVKGLPTTASASSTSSASVTQ